MPVAINVKSSPINEDFYNRFLEKIKIFAGERTDPDDFEFWKNQLETEARMTFNLLPLQAYDSFVFKNLDEIVGHSRTKSASKLKGKGSKGSLRKSLTGSGSLRSFGSRIKSLSLLDSSAASVNNQDYIPRNLIYIQLKCLEIISAGERIKSFTDSLLESFWNSFESILLTGSAHERTAKNIIMKMLEIKQNWLLKKIVHGIEADVEVSDYILKYSSELHLKVSQLNDWVVLTFLFLVVS